MFVRSHGRMTIEIISAIRRYTMAQYMIVDILQRFQAKKMSGNYRFPREIINSISIETSINPQLVEATLKQNGFIER